MKIELLSVYLYPTIFTQLGNGVVLVEVPDVPHIHTEGDELAEAMDMAQDAVSMWLWDAENNDEAIPPASTELTAPEGSIINLVLADTDVFRRGMRFPLRLVNRWRHDRWCAKQEKLLKK